MAVHHAGSVDRRDRNGYRPRCGLWVVVGGSALSPDFAGTRGVLDRLRSVCTTVNRWRAGGGGGDWSFVHCAHVSVVVGSAHSAGGSVALRVVERVIPQACMRRSHGAPECLSSRAYRCT